MLANCGACNSHTNARHFQSTVAQANIFHFRFFRHLLKFGDSADEIFGELRQSRGVLVFIWIGGLGAECRTAGLFKFEAVLTPAYHYGSA
jgi:hypothetical protein